MRRSLLLSFFCCLIFPRAFASASSPNALDVLLKSTSISERRDAYMDILKDPGAYSDRILLGLDIWQKTRDQGIEVLNKLIYLAAVLKRDEFIEPLINIASDPKYMEPECIYGCPAILALAVLSISKRWTPPDRVANRENTYLHDLDLVLGGVSLSRSRPGITFARSEDQELLSKTETLSEEELIKRAAPFNKEYKTRWLATEVLSCIVMDDKNLVEFYWLALEEIGDRAFEFRNAIYRTILRAEKARAIKGAMK